LTPGGSSTAHIWLTPGGSSTAHIWLTPGGSSTAHIWLTPGGNSTAHIWLTPGGNSTVHIWLTPYVQQMALAAQRVLLLRATDGAGVAGFPKKHFFTCHGCDIYIIGI
jgi:hypothetical protein